MDRANPFAGRIKKLRKEIARAGLEGVIIAPGPNLRYYTGVTSILLKRPFLLFFPRDGEAGLVAPELEAGPYRASSVKLHVYAWRDDDGPAQAFAQAVKEAKVTGRWGVEGRMPYLFLHELAKYAKPDLDNAEPVLQRVREVKEDQEIALLRESARILSDTFRAIPGMIREGMTELELSRKISDAIYVNGGEAVEDVLVQSGRNAANPHAHPTEKKIKTGESLVVDVTSTYSGYFADITRSFILGRNRELESVYEKVLEAQERAISCSKSGATVGSVDAAARRYLRESRLERYFIHRTGHGIGLEVHEAPYIIAGGTEVLRDSMFHTVEPGVYEPGRLGIRIEDDLMSTRARGEVITKVPKEYGWWN